MIIINILGWISAVLIVLTLLGVLYTKLLHWLTNIDFDDLHDNITEVPKDNGKIE